MHNESMSPPKQPGKQYNKKKSHFVYDGDFFQDCEDKENEDNRPVHKHGEYDRALKIANVSTTIQPTNIPRPKLSAAEKMLAR